MKSGSCHQALQTHTKIWVNPVELDGVSQTYENKPLTGSCATLNTVDHL